MFIHSSIFGKMGIDVVSKFTSKKVVQKFRKYNPNFFPYKGLYIIICWIYEQFKERRSCILKPNLLLSFKG